MPVTLAEAKNNAQTDLDVTVIDEFIKSNDILNRITFDDCVSPTGGGSLVYGYRRLTSQRGAAFRAINSEYTPAEVTTTHETVELKPLGGSFQVDRVLARVGPAVSGVVATNMQQVIKATQAKFNDAVINGDVAGDANGFDGLSVILTGSDTEYLPLNNGVAAGYVDWTSVADKPGALTQVRHIDDWLSTLDGRPDVIYGNRKTLSWFKTLAVWVGQYDQTQDAFGRPVDRYNGIPLVDLRTKAGSNDDVIGIVTRDPDGAGAGGNITGLSDLYAVRYGLDGFHGAAMLGDSQLIRTWLPQFDDAGAVKDGECEMGPVAPVLKATKSAAVIRNIKVE